ncbi:hypothetical protein JCM24511_07353 [Saitozyma sp. JCM 24511]|nr:hypothetical protein JCM24511_07353 [Saitozyma sp. JCM 24511]
MMNGSTTKSDSGTRGRGKGLSHDVLGSFVSGYPPEFPLEARGLREVYDIQVFSLLGSQATGLANAEYDLTVVSLANKDARATKLPNLDTDPSRLVNKYLDSVADHKVRHRPTSNLPFHPIIFSLGGMMNGSTTKFGLPVLNPESERGCERGSSKGEEQGDRGTHERWNGDTPWNRLNALRARLSVT